LIKPINIWDSKRYERIKQCGHNIVFKNWMISFESPKAVIYHVSDVFECLVTFLISPFILLKEVFSLLYMLLPKIFIKEKI
jgi:hypothetical protein